MKRLRLVLAFGLLALTHGLLAAITPAGRTEDLGQGLTYVRPAADTAESLALFKAVASGSVVLDLRYFSSGDHTSGWLAAIKAFAGPSHVCLVLVSPELAPDLAIGLSTGLPHCVTVGRDAAGAKADIAVEIPAETDRRAWESIGQGADLKKLIAPEIDKPRYDEAVLAKQHAADVTGAALPADSAADDDAPPETPAKKTPAPAKPAPLVDAVLQRAVQIDRGLVALGKL